MRSENNAEQTNVLLHVKSCFLEMQATPEPSKLHTGMRMFNDTSFRIQSGVNVDVP